MTSQAARVPNLREDTKLSFMLDDKPSVNGHREITAVILLSIAAWFKTWPPENDETPSIISLELNSSKSLAYAITACL